MSMTMICRRVQAISLEGGGGFTPGEMLRRFWEMFEEKMNQVLYVMFCWKKYVGHGTQWTFLYSMTQPFFRKLFPIL